MLIHLGHLGRTRIVLRVDSPRGVTAYGMLAQLPPMTPQESAELTAIYGALRLLPESGRMEERPFRAPHYTVSPAGMVGAPGRPGEISLASYGVLYLHAALGLASFTHLQVAEVLRDGMSQGYPAAPHALVIDASWPYTYPSDEAARKAS